MTKVLTLLGTRPEIIRLSRVIPVLDETCDHVLVHTGQNYDDRLSGVFFREMGVREPDIHMGVRGAASPTRSARSSPRAEELFLAEQPDTRAHSRRHQQRPRCVRRASGMGIRVCHMEAGNRCFDDRVPEEVNRRVIDHSSSVLMPYTYRSRREPVREGIERQRIFVTGNPIKEVLDHYAPQIAAADPFSQFDVEPRQVLPRDRAPRRDDRLTRRASGRSSTALNAVASRSTTCRSLASLHPRTADKMRTFGVDVRARSTFVPPLGLFDFVRLEKEAFCVLSDSGTVQEECCIFGVPTVTMRDVTERPETIECGSNLLAGVEAERILPAIDLAVRSAGTWTPPTEYLANNVSDIVARIVLGIA